MYERENLPPTSMMTTQALPSYHHHHGAMPVKQETAYSAVRDRTTSPTVLQTAHSQDYAASPVDTSRSSTSSPLSSDHHYNHQHHNQHRHMAPPSAVSRSQMGTTQIAPVPVPVRSASWGAGSLDPAAGSSVPIVITTQDANSFNAMTDTNYKIQPKKTISVPAKKKQNAKNGASKAKADTVTARRQKRLERNRESARLSRRRRKQYLEVLEDRVSQLSIEMDHGRRGHAAKAIETVLQKRKQLLQQPKEEYVVPLAGALSRSSQELSVVSTFQTQQLKSFSMPAHSKFVLWLTLQGDAYFRGGRAASERLSAARIGERMLHSGNDRAAPSNSMWPLFCNEVGLSYDQEERARTFQRTLLQEHTSWLDRHTARASGLAMQSFHESYNAVGQAVHQREGGTMAGLTAAQRLKFLVWSEKNAGRIKAKFAAGRQAVTKPKETEKFQLSKTHHVAANLYILNHRLQQVLKALPQQVRNVTPGDLKRLARRPSFEPLGQQKDEQGRILSRDLSFPSSGSLGHSTSQHSMGGEEGEHPPQMQVAPEEGQEAAAPTVEKFLGFVKELIPPPVAPVPLPVPQAPMALPPPVPAPAAYHHYASQPPVPGQPMSVHPPRAHAAHHPAPIAAQPTHIGAQAPISQPPHAGAQAPISHPPHLYQHQQQQQHHTQHQQYYHQHPPQPQMTYAQPPPPAPQPGQVVHYYHVQYPPQGVAVQPAAAALQLAPAPGHVRKSSFLPPHLNVVPEEMFPTADGAADDFFMSLIDDEDWAIGGGVEMDMTR